MVPPAQDVSGWALLLRQKSIIRMERYTILRLTFLLRFIQKLPRTYYWGIHIRLNISNRP